MVHSSPPCLVIVFFFLPHQKTTRVGQGWIDDLQHLVDKETEGEMYLGDVVDTFFKWLDGCMKGYEGWSYVEVDEDDGDGFCHGIVQGFENPQE